MAKPTITMETIEKFTLIKKIYDEGPDTSILSIDKMVEILKQDPHWELASTEQCITAITRFLVELAKS